ncbi:MAG: hypothetical protein JRK53_21975 [Deltaproteobacteria bacterium]|nr:hypothetical protein [Deltaproteobacteria bacterium]MBW1818647.1 hypothetical protein [Deltaproteobacteria bacterium]
MSSNKIASSGWRTYQEGLRRETRRDFLLYRLPVYALVVAVILIFIFAGYHAGTFLSRLSPGASTRDQPKATEEETCQAEYGEAIGAALAGMNFDPGSIAGSFVIDGAEPPAVAHTFLEPGLQRYIVKLLRRSRTLQAGVVVMKPSDGRILAMAAYGDTNDAGNLNVRAEFPAASLFKIVSAAAALDAAGFTPDRRVFYHGKRHTLYKGQLKKEEGKNASSTSFSRAFGSSINPVFGKLGIFHLGRELMTRYAERFYFNRTIPFDMNVAQSVAEVPSDDFGLAEVSSGFNKKTLISPLHAVLLAAAAANNGIIMKPRLIDYISGPSEEILYRSRPQLLGDPITRGAARDLRVLMKETVIRGTCRKRFRRLRRSKACADVDLGAKTGTINDTQDRYKFDWLVAYALPSNAEGAICLAVLGVHGEKLGIRATELGSLIIRYHLKSLKVAGRD